MENFWEKLSLVDLVPLGAVTTSLGTLDPLDYGHFMLIAVRHKNVYNTDIQTSSVVLRNRQH